MAETLPHSGIDICKTLCLRLLLVGQRINDAFRNSRFPRITQQAQPQEVDIETSHLCQKMLPHWVKPASAWLLATAECLECLEDGVA